MNGGFEAFCFHLEVIASDGYANDVVDTILIRDGSPVRATISIVGGHGGADEGRTARIGDGAGNCCGDILSPRCIRAAQ